MVQNPAAAFDPFTPPAITTVGALHVRDRAAVQGVVTDLTIRRWAGAAPTLHVTITDDTGSFTAAFLGRTRIAGVRLGATITLGGTVMLRRGRRLFMNPHLWLTGRVPSPEKLGSDRELAHA